MYIYIYIYLIQLIINYHLKYEFIYIWVFLLLLFYNKINIFFVSHILQKFLQRIRNSDNIGHTSLKFVLMIHINMT